MTTMTRVLFAALFLLAACSGDDDGDGPTSGGVDRADARDAAAASAEETQQAVDAIAGSAGALTPGGLRAGDRLALAIPLRPLCATVSSTTDTDGDGTVDNAVYTYELPACELARFRGGDLALTGAIRVSDPDPQPGYAYRLEYQDLKWDMTMDDTTRSFATTRNGTRELALENGTLVLTSALTMQRAFGARGGANIGSEITSVFTPSGVPLDFTLPMPDGTIEQTGTGTMLRGGVNERYEVRTVVPLRIEANCAAYPRITQGEVQYVAADSAFVRVTWPGCGLEPVMEVVEP